MPKVKKIGINIMIMNFMEINLKIKRFILDLMKQIIMVGFNLDYLG